MKFKINKNYTRQLRRKIKNQKNENQSGKTMHDKLKLKNEIEKK